MVRVLVVSAVLLPALGGCVSQVQLANDKGQVAECSAAGLGIISSIIAASAQHNCVEQYQKQGFHQVPASSQPAPASPAAAPPGQATQK